MAITDDAAIGSTGEPSPPPVLFAGVGAAETMGAPAVAEDKGAGALILSVRILCLPGKGRPTRSSLMTFRSRIPWCQSRSSE